MGKSRLVLESLKNIKSVYFLATETNESISINQLKEAIGEQMGDKKIDDIKDDWEAIFRHCIDIKVDVIVIDEFPYLITANKAIKSIFQRVIDLYLSQTSMTLILMGSSISIMEDEVLSTKSPLYGRRTAQIKLTALKFKYIHEMFPDYSLEDLIRVYATLGGIPYYLQQFNSKLSFWDNIVGILDQHNILFEEVKIFLLQELRQISTYSAIIQYIATGATKIGEIKSKTKIKSDISPYLNTLQRLDIIERKVPVSEHEIKSRNGRYYLKDNYFAFWFNFISRYREQIVLGVDVTDKLRAEFPSYVGHIFENVVGQLLEEILSMDKLKIPFQMKKLSNWWYKDIEIDLVGINNDSYLFVEIKWKDLNKKTSRRLFKALREKVAKTEFIGKFYYLIIARSIENIQLEPDEYLLDLKTLVNMLSN